MPERNKLANRERLTDLELCSVATPTTRPASIRGVG
jgi:hypothetical protein